MGELGLGLGLGLGVGLGVGVGVGIGIGLGAQSIAELWASAKESRRAAHHSSSPEPQSQDESVPLPAGRFSTLQEAQSSPSCPSRHVLFKPPKHAAPGMIESPPARSREGADSHGHTRVRLAPAVSAP